MRPRWHFVLSFTKHSVQQNLSPLDPQSNLMVSAMTSKSLAVRLFANSPPCCLCPHTPFFNSADNTLLKLSSMCSKEARVDYATSIKWKMEQHFWMSFKFSPLPEVREGIKAAAKQASVFFPIKKSRLSHSTYAGFLPSTVSRWLLSRSERGRAYPYYTASSGFFA